MNVSFVSILVGVTECGCGFVLRWLSFAARREIDTHVPSFQREYWVHLCCVCFVSCECVIDVMTV